MHLCIHPKNSLSKQNKITEYIFCNKSNIKKKKYALKNFLQIIYKLTSWYFSHDLSLISTSDLCYSLYGTSFHISCHLEPLITKTPSTLMLYKVHQNKTQFVQSCYLDTRGRKNPLKGSCKYILCIRTFPGLVMNIVGYCYHCKARSLGLPCHRNCIIMSELKK